MKNSEGCCGHVGMPGPMEGAVASILLQLPFYKHVFGWIGGHEAGDMPALYLFVLSKCCTPVRRSATAAEEASPLLMLYPYICKGHHRDTTSHSQ